MGELVDARRESFVYCYNKLTDSDKQMLMCRYTPGETLVELAKEKDRPVDSIYQSIGRIRRRLIECIRRRMASQDRVEGPSQ